MLKAWTLAIEATDGCGFRRGLACGEMQVSIWACKCWAVTLRLWLFFLIVELPELGRTWLSHLAAKPTLSEAFRYLPASDPSFWPIAAHKAALVAWWNLDWGFRFQHGFWKRLVSPKANANTSTTKELNCSRTQPAHDNTRPQQQTTQHLLGAPSPDLHVMTYFPMQWQENTDGKRDRNRHHVSNHCQ